LAGGSNDLPLAWVVGSGGLLGQAVFRRLHILGREVRTSRVPWADPQAALEVLLADARALPTSRWQVYWCAGAGVLGTSPAQLDAEVALLGDFLERWHPAGQGARQGLFMASSAGGVYAGASDPPFTERTPAAPNSPYGEAKLRSEALAGAFAERTGVSLLVGRISNLYGPGQDISKPQGLISHLCRAQLTRQPLSIYVSLDTMRDYVYVEDAGTMAVAALDAVVARGGQHVKVLASEQSTTIGSILGDLRRITRRRPPVVLGTSPSARFQVRDLRMRSVAWPPTSQFARTPMSAGIAATLAAVGDQLRPVSRSR
jgi:UDP-glucose 4-epimerase